MKQLPEDHGRRMDQARKRALWELGDETWAEVIIGSYLHPEADAEALRAERDEVDA